MDSKEINWEYKYKRLKNTITACLLIYSLIFFYDNWADFKCGAQSGWDAAERMYPNK